MKTRVLLLVTSAAISACSQPQPAAESVSGQTHEVYDYDKLVALYYEADTVIERKDSLFIVNTKLDTTVIETGVFTYLQYDYLVGTPNKLVQLVKQATQAERAGDCDRATSSYQAAVNFYRNDWLKRKSGFENGGFSDLNDYYAANVNVAILVSYAFEKLGRLPEALRTLAPFLANVEAENSKIQLRYVQLCLQQYGRAATRQALDASGKTVFRTPSEDSPEGDRWRVKVFGADLGVADFNTDTLSPEQAQVLVRKQPYYALVR